MAQQRERYFFMHYLIFIRSLSILGKMRGHKELHLIKTCIGAMTLGIIYYFQIEQLRTGWLSAKCAFVANEHVFSCQTFSRRLIFIKL